VPHDYIIKQVRNGHKRGSQTMKIPPTVLSFSQIYKSYYTANLA